MANIDQVRANQLLNTNTTQSNRTQSYSLEGQNTDKSSNTKTDAFSLSDQSKAIGSLNQKMAGEEAFDKAKVEAIKNAIANGSYKVDAERLAESIVNLEKTLVSTNKP